MKGVIEKFHQPKRKSYLPGGPLVGQFSLDWLTRNDQELLCKLNMPFENSARQLVPTLPVGDPMRVTLEFLLLNHQGVGRQHAMPTQRVLTHLAGSGHPMSKEHFQQTILNDTRGGNVFIGVCPRGIYLIHDRDDAIATRDFYSRRIRSELKHRKNLKRLVRAQGWQRI